MREKGINSLYVISFGRIRAILILSLSHRTQLLLSCFQSYPTLCYPIDGSPRGSSIPGILQARTLQWAAISFFNACTHAKLLQSCPTLCDPMDSSPPDSSVHGILQARILECVTISFSTTVYMDHIFFIHSSVDVFFQMGMFSNSSVQDPFLACVFSLCYHHFLLL